MKQTILTVCDSVIKVM